MATSEATAAATAAGISVRFPSSMLQPRAYVALNPCAAAAASTAARTVTTGAPAFVYPPSCALMASQSLRPGVSSSQPALGPMIATHRVGVTARGSRPSEFYRGGGGLKPTLGRGQGWHPSTCSSTSDSEAAWYARPRCGGESSVASSSDMFTRRPSSKRPVANFVASRFDTTQECTNGESVNGVNQALPRTQTRLRCSRNERSSSRLTRPIQGRHIQI